MSRPKPKVLLRYTDSKTLKTEEILEASAIYAVFHKGKPINLKTKNSSISYQGSKYKRTAFSSPGHAHNLAEKLNAKYKTNDFTVVELLEGQIVVEDNEKWAAIRDS